MDFVGYLRIFLTEKVAANMPDTVKTWLGLIVLAYVYVVGELSHFLLGIVSRPMSQDLHYGDRACLPNPEAPQQSSACITATNATAYASFESCIWFTNEST
ncbi:uncharacterized protein [Penaeus vannamei]|uniref:uncharacterized protein n=1 Tax=Penaeus vannamei TaxID=6689 RepID=UPI00387F38E0